MSSMQIIEAFKQLPLLERQAVLEKILQLEGKKPTIKRYLTRAEKHSRLAAGSRDRRIQRPRRERPRTVRRRRAGEAAAGREVAVHARRDGQPFGTGPQGN